MGGRHLERLPMQRNYLIGISIGLVVGLLIAVAMRPVVPGIGQPPIDAAFQSLFVTRGAATTRSGDFLTDQMVRLNNTAAADYADSFRNTLLIWAGLGACAGAIGAFGVTTYRRFGTKEATGDHRRWSALVEVDPEIAAAAAEARELGPTYERSLQSKYLALNDKAYLPQIMQRLREAARDDALNQELLAEEQVRVDALPQGRFFDSAGTEIEYERLSSGKVKITAGLGTGRVFADLGSLKRYAGLE
jgi:hypothetical protein